ncbi:MAG: HlyD family secretion protein [Sulfurimonadaceae bacterium]|jgi:predicted RNA-binding protein with TRAM domain|nr:HlyD family secretion protein [Sulfurimonadaceae bacterium]
MRIIILFLFSCSLLFSKIYYAKQEPYEVREIAANISGLVIFSDETKLGEQLQDAPYALLDDELDKKELLSVEKKIILLEKSIKNNEEILENLAKSLTKKQKNYKRIEKLTIKSTLEKDREFHDLVASQNQYLSTEKELQSLEIQITDLKLRSEVLERSIKDKSFSAKGFVLYSLEVKKGEVVPVASKIAKIADISRGKLVIYLDAEDVDCAEKKTIYLDGVKSSYKLLHIIPIADGVNISKYMAQIITDAPKVFSKLIKVELRDE